MRLAFFLALSLSAQEPAVHFKTADGWRLAAVYHEPAAGKPVAVLIHGVASARSEWDEFSRDLWALGVGTLALDLRGHGESFAGPRGRRGFADFDAAREWPKAEKDLDAAIAFLAKRRIPVRRVAVVGASIGANLASWAAERRALAWTIMLSPGSDYRGVGLAAPAAGPVLLGASAQDRYAFSAALRLAGASPAAVLLEAREGHGVQMFKDPEFRRRVLAWVSERLKKS